MSNKMWGGRFAAGPGAIMQEINASIGFDRRLYRQDIAASKAHAAMLAKQGIISREDAAKIARGLDTILSEMDSGKFRFKRELEDIHMNVESRLAELIGPAAGRLHTARSRNDQVATDFKLWVRDAIDDIDAALAGYQKALAEKALKHAATVMPGFTHLQTAQPVTFGHHLLAYVEMAARDRGRFADARKRLNENPLGSAALAGTSFRRRSRHDGEGARLRPAGREFARCGVGPRLRDRDARRRLDRGGASLAPRRGDRDLVLAARRLHPAVRQVHHRLVDHAAEAQSGRRRAGARQDRPHLRRAAGLLVVMKGLPLAYQKDMQEDKEAAMDALSALMLVHRRDGRHGADMVPDAERMKAAAGAGYATATDLADWLVRTLKMPFREAHHITGRIVAAAEQAGVPLDELPLARMQAIEPRITEAVFGVLSVERSVAEPHSLRRHGAEERHAGSQEVAETPRLTLHSGSAPLPCRT